MCRFIVLFLLILPLTGIAQPSPVLIPYNAGHSWGYSDVNGSIVIPARFAYASFFDGARAKVPCNGSYTHFSLIDRNGHYIIPPSRNWNGHYSNSETNLNCFDSSGKLGLVDSNNHLLVACEYDRTANTYCYESFRVLSKNNLYGTIDRFGKTVIPFKYKSLHPLPEHSPVNSFFKFQDSIGPPGKFGILDINGNVILPPTYFDIIYNNEFKKTGFVVMKEKKKRKKKQELYEYKWLSYPSLKEYTRPKFTPYHTQPVWEEKFGDYVLFHRPYHSSGLMDSLGNILIPEGSIHHVTRDTIVLWTYKQTHDTSIYQYSYLNARNLKPYCEPVKKYGYVAQHYAGCDPYSNYSYLIEQKFYKDSFLFTTLYDIETCNRLRLTSISDEMKTRLEPFIVSGRVHNGRTTYDHVSPFYGALVDKNKNYVVPPIEGAYIVAYNKADDIVTYRDGYGFSYDMVNSRGETLGKFATRDNVQGGCRWHGNLYAYIKKTKPLIVQGSANPSKQNGTIPTREIIQVVDVNNIQADTWRQLAFRDTFPRALLEKGEVAFVAMDTDWRCKIVTPDGQVLNQKLSGKYSSMHYLQNGYFMVGLPDQKDTYKIVDKDNRDLIPGLLVRQVSVFSGAEICDFPRGEIRSHNYDIPLPLMLVNAYINGRGATASFYINFNGLAYTDLIKSR